MKKQKEGKRKHVSVSFFEQKNRPYGRHGVLVCGWQVI